MAQTELIDNLYSQSERRTVRTLSESFIYKRQMHLFLYLHCKLTLI